jgi:holliday junction DNA helicase RuvA
VIASLRGALLEKSADQAVVEAGGVGYAVAVGPSTAARLPPVGEEVFFFVEESVAMYGGGVTLYGFLRAEDRRLFNVLRDQVPGTGAKKAMEFLEKAAKSPPDFRRAVLDKDARALIGIFGFTAKTAEKIIAALQGALGDMTWARPGERAPASSHFEEAVQGLVSLGYKEAASRQAAQAARQTLGDGFTPQDLIRESLRQLSGRR